LFRADGQTDMTMVIVTFLILRTRLKRLYTAEVMILTGRTAQSVSDNSTRLESEMSVISV